MIEILKKYPKTFKEFEKYMADFYLRDQGLNISFGSCIEIRCERCERETIHDIPDKFLIGCLMEFLAENHINISIHSAIAECILLEMEGNKEAIVHPSKTSAFAKAFEILENKQ